MAGVRLAGFAAGVCAPVGAGAAGKPATAPLSASNLRAILSQPTCPNPRSSADFKRQVVVDAFADVDLQSLESAARAAAAGRLAADEEEEADSGSGSARSGKGASPSLEAAAAREAEEIATLFDRRGLGARVAAEAERLARAEAERQAAAAAAAAAAESDVQVAEQACEALDATVSATDQLLSIVIRAVQQRNEVLRQLPLRANPAALALVRQANGLVGDAVSCAMLCLDGPARSIEPRELDVGAAVAAWQAAANAGDDAGLQAARQRLRQLRAEAEAELKRASGYVVRATVLVDQAATLLNQAEALPALSSSGSSGEGSGEASGSDGSVLRAQDAAAAADLLDEGVELVQQLGAALLKFRQTASGAAFSGSTQQPPAAVAAPDPSAVAMGAAVAALAATKLGQPLPQPGTQQPRLPGGTDLPSAVLAARGSPQQASSAAIAAALAQARSGSSFNEQAAAAAELKQQAEQLSPEQASAAAGLVLGALMRGITSSADTAEALGKVRQMQGMLSQQQQAEQLPPAAGLAQADQQQVAEQPPPEQQ